MKINYNVTGSERKSLVAAITQELNTPSKYLGAPTFAYEVGGYHIDKNGTLTGEEDNPGLVADLCGLHSFTAVSEEYDEPTETTETPAFENLHMTEREELGLGQERRDPIGENGMQAGDVPDPDANDSNKLTIEIPLDGFNDKSIENLGEIVASKNRLIKKALGTNSLRIDTTDDKLLFPWFTLTGTDGEVEAYSAFVSLLCKTAKEKKHITAKEKDVGDNPKYAMRCFLLSLGFIGDEYKTARKILLSNLEGNSSWGSNEAYTAMQEQRRKTATESE